MPVQGYSNYKEKPCKKAKVFAIQTVQIFLIAAIISSFLQCTYSSIIYPTAHRNHTQNWAPIFARNDPQQNETERDRLTNTSQILWICLKWSLYLCTQRYTEQYYNCGERWRVDRRILYNSKAVFSSATALHANTTPGMQVRGRQPGTGTRHSLDG